MDKAFRVEQKGEPYKPKDISIFTPEGYQRKYPTPFAMFEQDSSLRKVECHYDNGETQTHIRVDVLECPICHQPMHRFTREGDFVCTGCGVTLGRKQVK